MTEIKGAIAGTQNNFLFFFPCSQHNISISEEFSIKKGFEVEYKMQGIEFLQCTWPTKGRPRMILL